jgi:hypothetical protein
MNIEHLGLLSSVRESRAASKNKNHAQDGETLIEAISVRRSCHGFWISDGGHPFASHGHLARYAQQPDCHGALSSRHDFFVSCPCA